MSKPSPNSSAGFTLLELMIVLVIIAILAGAFVVTGGSIFKGAAEKEARVRLAQLGALVEQYAQVEGDYPDDRLPRGATANAANSQAEALVVALFDPGYRGSRPSQDWLGNTDGDSSQKQLTIFANRELFEILDPWGNPILYFESLHYSTNAEVFAGPDETYEDQVASPFTNEETGTFEQPNAFQLISCGADGFFGTEDDLAHYRN